MVILQIARMVEDRLGAEARDAALREAQVFRLPETDEPVREEKAARLHAAVRRLWPEEADAIGRSAGEGAAEFIMEHRLSKRARTLMSAMPKASAAWLLSRRTEQLAWTFVGSGRFEVETSARFAIFDNPLIRGERANRAICFYHAGLFERQFRALIHPGTRCAEVACAARGDPACQFRLTVPSEGHVDGPLDGLRALP